jgi:signal transduction histidine kinase
MNFGGFDLDSVAAMSVRSMAEGASLLVQVPLEELMLGSPIPLSDLKRGKWIPWSQFVDWFIWMDRSPHGPFNWKSVGEISVQSPSLPGLRPIVQMTLSVRFGYWLAGKWFGPSQFPGISSKFEELGPRLIRETLTLHESLKPCPQVFEIFQGSLAVLPEMVFGLPRSVVVASILERGAIYQITLPTEQSLWKKIYFFIQSLFNVRALLREMVSQQEILREQSNSILQERSEFKNLIDGFPDGVLIYQQGRIRYANPYLANFLKFENPKKLVGLNILDLLHPEDRVTILKRIQIFETNPKHINPPAEFRFFPANSEMCFGECTSVGTTFEGLPAVAVIIRDLSEQKKLQAHIMLTDRMRALGQLAAGVGHEVNNPLFYVMMKAESLEKSLGADGLLIEKKQVAQIQEGLERIKSIVRQLKTFSRTDSEDRRSLVNVQNNLRSALGMARNTIEHRARLKMEIQENLPLVAANEARLGQVFLNLLINAAQAIEPGRADQNVISVKAFLNADHQVVIEVCDTGHGIPENVKKNLFQPFYTTKPMGEGTGLGLSICHSIVIQYGGSIQFEDAPGRGTVFRVILPAAEQTANQQAENMTKAEVTRTEMTKQNLISARVLLIDDDEELLEVLESVVGLYHQVTAVPDANLALQLIRDGSEFDCIICDLMMPNLGGVDFYDRLKEISPEHCGRIVFMTGGSFTTRTDQFLRRPEIRSREKPISTADLLELIQEVVKLPPAETIPSEGANSIS